MLLFTAVTLQSGETIACKRLVFATGTQANVQLAQETGLAIGQGITIDGDCRTSNPAISAIGECAEWSGERFGTTASARTLARACAADLNGVPHQQFSGTTVANILKVPGVELAAAGLVDPDPTDEAYQTILVSDVQRQYYLKCVVHKDRLVGCILLGDTSRFAEYLDLIETGMELDEMRDELLRPGSDSASVEGNLVCSCNRIGDETILNHITAGVCELDQLCEKSKAGTGCGSCRPEVAKLLQQHAPKADEVMAVS